MISKAMQDAFNQQIQAELYSAYIYLSMSAHFESANLPGAAQWMRLQNEEEVGHAMRFFDFIHDRGGRVTLQAIEQPPTKFESALQVFEAALKHEQKVTGMINNLYALAVKENDYASQVMLQWFVDEQVEEEKSATEIVEKLKMIGDQKGLLLMLDHELGERELEEE